MATEIDLGIDGLSDVVQIGHGGSARVFRARQFELDRTVAVKVLNSAWDEDVQRRFSRERRAMGRLSDHPGIVGVYQAGTTKTGQPYVIMPLYDGSLRDRIEAGPVPWREAVEKVRVVADTMSAAHAIGVIHRDLKPANLLISGTGDPKVADFGISRLNLSETASQSSALTFTPAYSPPESFTGATATQAVDVYGMGATLWALLAGHPPFSDTEGGVNLLDLMYRVTNSPVDAPTPQTPPNVTQVLQRAMAKQPEDRYPSAKAFRDALDELLSGGIVNRPNPVLTPVRQQQVLPSVAPTQPDPVQDPPDRRTGVSPVIAGLAIVVALLMGAVGALVFTLVRGDGTDRSIAASGTVSSEEPAAPSGEPPDGSEEPTADSVEDGGVSGSEPIDPTEQGPSYQVLDPVQLSSAEVDILDRRGYTERSGAPSTACAEDSAAPLLQPQVNDFLNVRSGAGTSNPIVMRLGPDILVRRNFSMSRDDGFGTRWVGIHLPGNDGQCAWVHPSYVAVPATNACRVGETFIFGGPTRTFDARICENDATGLLRYRGVRLSDGAAIDLPACARFDGYYEARNSGTVYSLVFQDGGFDSFLDVVDPDGEVIVNEALIQNVVPEPVSAVASC